MQTPIKSNARVESAQVRPTTANSIPQQFNGSQKTPLSQSHASIKFFKTTQQVAYDSENLKSRMLQSQDQVTRYKPRAVSNYAETPLQKS